MVNKNDTLSLMVSKFLIKIKYMELTPKQLKKIQTSAAKEYRAQQERIKNHKELCKTWDYNNPEKEMTRHGATYSNEDKHDLRLGEKKHSSRTSAGDSLPKESNFKSGFKKLR